LSDAPAREPASSSASSAPVPSRGDRLVSVVIPTKNAADHIARTLAAVFDQGPAAGVKLEVVVADDGSTDDTAAIACGAGARVILLGGPRSQGLGGSPEAARRRGAAAALGDPILFLDADCTPGPGWLQAILDAHDRSGLPALDPQGL
jgi:glycosyltransferase involved in cell wall biosynthesis